MLRWLLQLAFGMALGIAARVSLPGHHPKGMLLAGLLSLAGAAGGGFLGELILPRELLGQGSLVLAGMGALATLLVQALVSG